MFPQAPQLLSLEGMVTDDPVGVTYWKVQNGIRLSGMPSFKLALSDQQKWDVSAFLARADELPQAAKNALNPEPQAAGASVASPPVQAK
jgi:mono/diheme cytochrome c family protein